MPKKASKSYRRAYEEAQEEIARLQAALKEIITHDGAITSMRCLAARALDDPGYWYIYREWTQVDDLRKSKPKV